MQCREENGKILFVNFPYKLANIDHSPENKESLNRVFIVINTILVYE